ncbi:DNA-3-methyladenine glycosylase 2 family protein, partial [Streptomyces massasporeus]
MAGRFRPPTPTTRTTIRGGHTPVPTPPDSPVDLGLTLGPLRRGPADPTFPVTPDGSVCRASRTPDGPGTIRVAVREGTAAGAAEAEAWGPGATWLLDNAPALLGAEDDPTAFVPRHKLVLASHRRRPGLRLTRTGLVLESLIPTILEQKVTTTEAYGAWRQLVRTYGARASAERAATAC